MRNLQGNVTTSTISNYATTTNYLNSINIENNANYAITSGSTVDFTGSLNGIVTGTQSAITIPNRNITNAMLVGSIDNSKLLTLTTSGLVVNSLTTAINSNTLNTIVLKNSSGNIIVSNILLQSLSTYYNLSILDRNSIGYLFGNFLVLRDSIYFSLVFFRS